MPNGHGGIPRFGGPVFYAVAAGLAFAFKLYPAAAALAGIAGWRLAYHLHFWGADEYDGAYTSPEKYRRAKLRYYAFAVLYASAGAAAVLATA